jgi:glutaredoxin/glutathione-dependent peroxiredoxin
MTIAVGDKIPDVKVAIPGAEGPKRVQTSELLGSGRVVLFGVPGAFTPTCSDYHLPGFVLRADDLKAKGVDVIACVSVNDQYVMAAWAEARGVGETVVMIADGSADLTKALGLEIDLSGGGLGLRSRRFAAIIDDGVVTDLAVEDGLGLNVSTADAVLAKL